MRLNDGFRVKLCFCQLFEPPYRVILGKMAFVASEWHPRLNRSIAQHAMYRVHISSTSPEDWIEVPSSSPPDFMMPHSRTTLAITLMLKTKKPESSQYLFMAYSILDVVSKYSNANAKPELSQSQIASVD
jgi:hypothetical protein